MSRTAIEERNALGRCVARQAEELEQARQENERLRAAVRRARLYAGDNLPAAPGLTLVAMLEKALKGDAA